MSSQMKDEKKRWSAKRKSALVLENEPTRLFRRQFILSHARACPEFCVSTSFQYIL